MSALARKNSNTSTGLTLDELVRDIVVNDEKWRCIVTMLLETSESQAKYISMLTEACAKGCRKVIYHISNEKMSSTVNSIISDNSMFAVSPSRSLQRIRQCAQSTIASITNPTNSTKATDHLLEAALIKWLIYEARLESLARNNAESEIAAARDLEILTLNEILKRSEKKSKTGRSATAESRVGSARRANSRLKKRGEEWRDRIYVDDAPLNGPDLYILLTGFYEPELPRNLIKIGVPLKCILKIENFRTTSLSKSSTTVLDGQWLRIPDKPRNFWKDFHSEELGDVAVRSFCPTFHDDSDLSDIYDDISYILYDVHDLLEGYDEYLANMQVIQVQDVLLNEEQHHMRVYETIMNHVLEEATGVPELVEAMLRQIEDDFKENDDEMDLSANKPKTEVASLLRHSRISDRYLREQTHSKNDVYDEHRLFSSFPSVAPAPLQREKPSTLPEAASSTATSLSKVNSAAFAHLTEKLRLLNLKYELISRANDSSSPRASPEPELILHGDSLRLNACRANDEEERQREAAAAAAAATTRSEEPGWKLPSFQVSLQLEEPRIAEAWRRKTRDGLVEVTGNCCFSELIKDVIAARFLRADYHQAGKALPRDDKQEYTENVIEKCEMHLPRIFQCCKKQGIDESRAKHLLNLLGFKKMLESHCSNFLKSEISLSKLEAEEKLSTLPRDTRKLGKLKIETDSRESTNRLSNEGFAAQKNGVQEMNIITNDKVTNLTENNSRSPELRNAGKIANHILDNFNLEANQVYKRQLGNIIFDEFAEKITAAGNRKNSSFSNATMKRIKVPQWSNNRTDGNSDCRCAASSPTEVSSTSTLKTESRPHEKPQHGGTFSDQQQQVENTSKVFPRVSSLNSSPSSIRSHDCELSRFLRSFERCSSLFGLIDATVVALDGQLQCPMALEEFEDAELLAPSAFLQIVRDCFQEYGDLVAEARHFAPTDSILLLFGEPRCLGETTRQDVTCTLRTPVCLRDFCEFVVEEEREWLEMRRRRRSGASKLNERSRKQILGDEETRAIFRDEDFLLPGSLKACTLREFREQPNDGNAGDETVEENEGKPSSKQKNAADSSLALSSSKLKTKLDEKRSTRLRSLASSFSSSRSSLTEAPAASFDFIGYDLGDELRRRRVQVSNLCRKWMSRADGTRLRLTRESWYPAVGKLPDTTSISVTIPERGGEKCHLEYHEVKGEEMRSLFHVLMSSGVVVAFSRLPRADTEQNELLYEFQISWPSGLIIKPVEHQGAYYPFYILQYYTSTGPRRQNIKDEKYRKYLHNGDVVKFLNDGSITVLRVNGTVITIVTFEEDADSYWLSESEISYENLPVRTAHKLGESSEMVCPAPLRYVVLELDGRRYEVFEGRGRRELDRLRADVAEDYSPEEKFARRADGTDALFNADAELVVNFPDGTRILSTCSFEDNLIHCDWNPDELELYFGADKQPDGFVSVLVASRIEHPNYATVSHDFGSLCCLSICSESQIELQPRGICRLICSEDQVQIDLTKDEVSITRNSSCDCDNSPSSKTTFYLVDDTSTSNPLSSENLDRRLLMTFRDNATHLAVRRDDVDFEITSTTSELPPSICDCGKKKSEAAKSGCRLFAVNRQGEACEYHHRSVWRQYAEKLMSGHEEASLIHRPIQGRTEMEYRLALLPLGAAENWIPDYQIPKAKPSLKHRFVHGSADDSEDYDEPLKASVSSTLPRQRRARFLMARLFEGIGRHGENSLISMQKALLNYWCELATGVPYQRDHGSDSNGSLLTCDCQEVSEDQLIKNIVTEKVTMVPMEMYEAGRQHLRELKAQREATRTRQMIDRCYQRNATPDECPWLG